MGSWAVHHCGCAHLTPRGREQRRHGPAPLDTRASHPQREAHGPHWSVRPVFRLRGRRHGASRTARLRHLKQLAVIQIALEPDDFTFTFSVDRHDPNGLRPSPVVHYVDRMSDHDIHSFATGLSARLATRSRHVNLFLGAGSSKSAGLPDVSELQAAILAELSEVQRPMLERLLASGNLETALTKIRRMVALLGPGDQIDGISADQARELDQAVCQLIIKNLSSTSGVDAEPLKNLAAWLVRATYVRPTEVFTVNYDLLLEQALDALGAPYFDGFGGLLEGHFRSDLVDAEPADELFVPSFFTRLWKLHGSLNWSMMENSVVRLGHAVGSEMTAAIYPSDAKYDESRRVPFVVLQDRFRRALNEPESLTLVAGYSWGDAHINEQMYDAATRRPRSEVIAFCYSSIPEELASRAKSIPNLQVIAPAEAIIGSNRAPWAEPANGLPEFVWADGAAQLGNFKSLATFLAKASGREQNAPGE